MNIGSPRAIAKDRASEKDQGAAQLEAERAVRTLHQEVLGARRGYEYLNDMLQACHFWEAVATAEEEGQRRYALRVLHYLGALKPENLEQIARFIVRLTTQAQAQERAIRVGPGTNPEEE